MSHAVRTKASIVARLGWSVLLPRPISKSYSDIWNSMSRDSAVRFRMNVSFLVLPTTPDGDIREREIIVLDKGHDQHEDTGLSIEEGKALLTSLQQKIVEAQAEAFCASKSVCPDCRRRLRRKGTHSIRYRTVFGDISVTGPRYITAVAARTATPRPSAP